MRPLKTVAAAILALTTTSPASGRFSQEVPSVVPSVDGWQHFPGDVEFGEPRVAVRYEFFVNPARQMIYEVVRYRVTVLGKGGAPDSVGNEKLQWDRNGRDLRRFECVGDDDGLGGCTWREMDRAGEEYGREVPVLLQMYFAHNSK